MAGTTTFQGIVTRNSNGSLELRPDNQGTLTQVEMGSRVEVTIEVVETAREIEEQNAESRAARGKPPATPQATSPARKTPAKS